MLRRCSIGEGSIQRTHHWSPLHYEVEFVQTPKDIEMASFDCAKDRHIYPWVDVNNRFGLIKYTEQETSGLKSEAHPSKLMSDIVEQDKLEAIVA
jgi:hypothetical protein